MNKPITSRFRFTLRTLAIIITAICCFLGFAVWFIRIVQEKNEQDRIRFALEAERQRIETLLKSITEIKFDSNQLVTETSLQKDKASGKSESVLTAPAKQDDFFGRWKCVDDSGELVLQLWEGKAADWGYNGKLFLTLPSATGAQSFDHLGEKGISDNRLLFESVDDPDLGVVVRGECVLLSHDRMQVQAELLYWRCRIKIDAPFIRVQ